MNRKGERVEYKIIKGNEEYCQKVLNQWKHKYYIIIYQMCITDNSVFILIGREEIKSNKAKKSWWDEESSNILNKEFKQII